ncbi:hypothetical protein L9F63_003148 [Diploptera punctata]|uniref:Ionotropic glutamate receptor L-glutamate and glycine-binding domain-containing protein n=1 Tax=Diploptera punctata TaxID=6984 RepID=A0AAD7ZKP0_DIPPU|nr:hypothetical protein L9F63_003148 [Diploptera punctata]
MFYGLKLALGSRSSDSKWLLFLNKEANPNELLNNTHVPLNCEFLIVQNTQAQMYELKEAYRVNKGLPLHLTNFGSWSEETGLLASSKHIHTRRADLGGVVLKTCTLQGIALRISQVKNDKIIKIGGYLGMIWNMLQENLNFKSDYYESKSYGGQLENGSWTGMVGLLNRREMDACAAVFIMDINRITAIDFTAPVLNQR